jgi:hypothetical protein
MGKREARLCEHRPMASRSTAAFGLAAVLMACAVSGCGSSGRSGPGPSPAQLAAHRRFVAQARAICHEVSAQQRLLRKREEALKGQPVGSAVKSFASLAGQAATIARTADGRLRALPRPTADAHAIAQTVQAYGEQASAASEIARAAAHEENSVGEAASVALSRSIAAHLGAARGLGMGGCLTVE